MANPIVPKPKFWPYYIITELASTGTPIPIFMNIVLCFFWYLHPPPSSTHFESSKLQQFHEDIFNGFLVQQLRLHGSAKQHRPDDQRYEEDEQQSRKMWIGLILSTIPQIIGLGYGHILICSEMFTPPRLLWASLLEASGYFLMSNQMNKAGLFAYRRYRSCLSRSEALQQDRGIDSRRSKQRNLHSRVCRALL